MANPSPDQITAIQDMLSSLPAEDRTSPAKIVATANAEIHTDPNAPEVPTTFATAELMAALSPTTIAGLADNPNLPRILEHVTSNDRPACNLWIATLTMAGKITAEETQALTAIVNATQPAPLTSWARLILGRDLDQLDVLAALEL